MLKDDRTNAALRESASALRAIANHERAERCLRAARRFALDAQAERLFNAIAVETAKLKRLAPGEVCTS